MRRTRSITLSESMRAFVDNELESGAYATSSEVICAGLRLLEKKRATLNVLRDAYMKGKASGVAEDFSWQGVKTEALLRAKSS